MKNIREKSPFISKKMPRIAIASTLLLLSTDLLAGGGTLGDAAQRGADNIPAITTFFIWLFGLVGVIFAGAGIIGFFKKGQPPETGKLLGMIFAGAILCSIAWLISTMSTSVAGSDQTQSVQGVIIE